MAGTLAIVALLGRPSRRPPAGGPGGERSPLERLRRRIDEEDVAIGLVAETMMVRHRIAPRHRAAVLAEVRRDWWFVRPWLLRRDGRAAGRGD